MIRLTGADTASRGSARHSSANNASRLSSPGEESISR